MTDRATTMWDVAADHARTTPSATAIFGERNYTYQDVMDRAGELSRILAYAVAPGQLIALETESAVSATVAILASGHLRCAVLPLAVDSPQAYRENVLADAGAVVVLRGDDQERFDVEPIRNGDAGPGPSSTMDETAYIIYTSGSTGRPKGVAVSHDALPDWPAALVSTVTTRSWQ